MLAKLAPYNKLVVAFVGFALTLAIHFFGEQSDVVFIIQALTAALTAVGVYAIPNKPNA